VTSLILPLALYKIIPGGFAGFIVSAVVCVAVSGLTVLFIGLDGNERKELFAMIRKGGKR
jgi:VIT1/CCC1 family predicted Fe2+/Mn2+ transporter